MTSKKTGHYQVDGGRSGRKIEKSGSRIYF